MTDDRHLTKEEHLVFAKARRTSGKKVGGDPDIVEPKNYEGDHYDTIAASLVMHWGEGLRGYQAANLQQAIANCIRNERGQQDEAIQCTAELIAQKDAEIKRLRKAFHAILRQYTSMIWGEDYEYREAGEKAQEIAYASLQGGQVDVDS